MSRQKVPVPGRSAPNVGSPAPMPSIYLDIDGPDDDEHSEICRAARPEPEPHTSIERSGGLVRLRGIGATENFRPRSRQDNSHGFYRLVLQIGSQGRPDGGAGNLSTQQTMPLSTYIPNFCDLHRRGRFAMVPEKCSGPE